MRTISKIIFRNKKRKNHEKAENYNLQKPFEMLLFLCINDTTLFNNLKLFTVLKGEINHEQKR